MTTRALVVVGANGTLGSHLCQRLSGQFSQLYAFDHEQAVEQNILPCDLSVEASVEAALSMLPISAHDHWTLIVASGVYHGRDDVDLRWTSIRRSLAINLLGVTQLVSGFIDQLVAAGRSARIVVISSAAARVGSSDIGYGVSKAGLEGLVRSCSKVYAKSGITILGVAPGLFDSKMSAAQSDRRRNAAVAATHLARAVTLDEVATTVAFAACNAPDALTGTILSPNGGQV
jgi:NAD(P)-dependent dehydrogenase (short-subunit alcohol dehydrogenase family)